MRNLKRNRTKIYYSLSNGTTTEDKYGNETYEYGDIKSCYMSLSVNTGNAQFTSFGKDLDFDRFMSSTDTECEIDEYSHLWIDADPDTEKYDYIVMRKAVTRRQVRYAIKRVTNE